MGLLTGNLRPKSAYLRWQVIAGSVLLYAAPFVSPLLVFVALAIFVARVVMNDAKSFASDYALLIPIAPLFSYQGMSLLIYLGLFAALWYFFTEKKCKKLLYAVLILVLNYILLRMPWNISGFVLCFGQLFMLVVILPLQDADSAQRAAKTFCVSLLVSSVFSLIMRDTAEMFLIRGVEYPAYWGSSTYRFHGMFEDPNYYMTLIVTAITLLMILFSRKHIKLPIFLVGITMLLVIGVLTYSKTFFLSVIILAAISIGWLFARKKHLLACGMIVAFVILFVTLLMTSTTFSVMIVRLTSANNLDDLTTGRSEVFAAYFQTIMESLPNALFGLGLEARSLGKDPHNIYLEISYYLGFVGLGLIIALFSALASALHSSIGRRLPSRYLTLVMAMLLHMTLHGIFSVITYGVFFFALLAMLIEEREEE